MTELNVVVDRQALDLWSLALGTIVLILRREKLSYEKMRSLARTALAHLVELTRVPRRSSLYRVLKKIEGPMDLFDVFSMWFFGIYFGCLGIYAFWLSLSRDLSPVHLLLRVAVSSAFMQIGFIYYAEGERRRFKNRPAFSPR